jgi:hypothetical protein
MVTGLVVYNCRNCGEQVVRDIEYTKNSLCDKCILIQELNIKYVGKKMTEVYQTVLDELKDYKGIVLNSDSNGNLAPIISKNIVKKLDEQDISKT